MNDKRNGNEADKKSTMDVSNDEQKPKDASISEPEIKQKEPVVKSPKKENRCTIKLFFVTTLIAIIAVGISIVALSRSGRDNEDTHKVTYLYNQINALKKAQKIERDNNINLLRLSIQRAKIVLPAENQPMIDRILSIVNETNKSNMATSPINERNLNQEIQVGIKAKIKGE